MQSRVLQCLLIQSLQQVHCRPHFGSHCAPAHIQQFGAYVPAVSPRSTLFTVLTASLALALPVIGAALHFNRVACITEAHLGTRLQQTPPGNHLCKLTANMLVANALVACRRVAQRSLTHIDRKGFQLTL